MRNGLACALLVILMLGIDTSARGVAARRVLHVGPHRPFRAPSAAARVARAGDIVEIDAAVYGGDVAVWTQDDLTIRGVRGRPHLRAAGAAAEGKGIWVVKGRHTTIENVEFSGAQVPEKNGAGIRQEGVGLTVRRCYFHDNEDGILGGGGPQSEVTVEGSEFAANGHGDGQSHNIYIGRVKRFTLRASFSHHARIGHNIKSRAQRTEILYSRVMDEDAGTSSYAIDVPDGGLAYLIGNVIQKGPRSEEPVVVAYGAEHLWYPVNELYAVNNTIVNDDPRGGPFFFVNPGSGIVRIVNNLLVGRGAFLKGPGELVNNVGAPVATLVDPRRFDYRLRAGSPAIDAGIDPGSAHGMSLTPVAQYVERAREVPRVAVGRLDVGAYEYGAGAR